MFKPIGQHLMKHATNQLHGVSIPLLAAARALTPRASKREGNPLASGERSK